MASTSPCRLSWRTSLNGVHSRVEVATWRLKRGAGRISGPYVLWRAQGVPSSMLEMVLVLVLGGVYLVWALFKRR